MKNISLLVGINVHNINYKLLQMNYSIGTAIMKM